MNQLFGENFNIISTETYLYKDDDLINAYGFYVQNTDGWYCAECDHLHNVILIFETDKNIDLIIRLNHQFYYKSISSYTIVETADIIYEG